MPPNLLLVVFDTARRDAFEPYGGPPGSTPAVRQLAARGQAHDRMYAPACWTVPSHAAMFAGALHRSLGLAHRGRTTPEDFRLDLHAIESRLLARVLHDAGYRTVGISANAWVHRNAGFDLGFDEFIAIPPRRHSLMASRRWHARLLWYVQALIAHLDDGARQVEAEIAQVLGRRGGRPFFLFVNLVECHSPYLPPRPFTTLGPVDRLRSAADARRYQTLEAYWRTSIGAATVPPRALARMRDQYAGSIRSLDAWLARVLDRLHAARLLDDTLVVVTSDHGENFGENGLLGHCFSLDDRLLRVPFITAGPAPLELPQIASLADVPAAVATALGVPHPWLRDERPTDTVVAQFDAPGDTDDPEVQRIVDGWHLAPEPRRRLCESFAAATDGRWKLVRRNAGDELFDLHADPLESAPTVGGPVGVAIDRLRAALDGAAAREVLPPHRASPSAVDHDPVIAERLRQLGYL